MGLFGLRVSDDFRYDMRVDTGQSRLPRRCNPRNITKPKAEQCSGLAVHVRARVQWVDLADGGRVCAA